MTKQERAARGARYRDLLRSGEMDEALASIEKQYTDELLGCFIPEGRERLWQAVQVVRKVKALLHSIVADGALAQHQLQELSRRL
jgi:hypothetical protein